MRCPDNVSLICHVCFLFFVPFLRINKKGSQKDPEQKARGNYFFYDDGTEEDMMMMMIIMTCRQCSVP